jgi:hypothetical protein
VAPEGGESDAKLLFSASVSPEAVSPEMEPCTVPTVPLALLELLDEEVLLLELLDEETLLLELLDDETLLLELETDELELLDTDDELEDEVLLLELLMLLELLELMLELIGGVPLDPPPPQADSAEATPSHKANPCTFFM